MQAWSHDGVRQERTGFRDESISRRHRQWGFNCPAVDLDFLVVEYNLGLPVGLIEYKHHCARMPNMQHATYRALSALADGYKNDPLPFLVVFYWPEIWAFRAYPVNDVARKWFREWEGLSEFEYVQRLYRMRRFTISQELTNRLNRKKPPALNAA